MKALLEESQDITPKNTNFENITIKEFKLSITLYEPKRTIKSILDAAKISDLLLIVINIEEGIDEEGQIYLQCLRAQGLPSIVFLFQGLDKVPIKKQKDLKRDKTKEIEKEFSGEQKIVFCDSLQEIKTVCRWINEHKIRKIKWREIRPYVITDSWNFTPSKENTERGTLSIKGYLRGNTLSPNNLIYIPKVGSFQVLKIIQEKKGEEEEIVYLPDELQEKLVSEIQPDTSLNEQTWPTKDDFKRPKDKKVDRLIHEEIEEDEEEEGDEEEEEEEEVDSQQGEGDDEVEFEQDFMDEEFEKESSRELKSEIQTQIDTKFDLSKDEDMTEEQREQERLAFLEKIKKSKEEMQFPDEVEVNPEEPARIRFQKYRGLKSFRTTYWNPKENLPLDYGRIFQFQSFAKTQKKALKDLIGAKKEGYYTIEISNVPSSFVQKYQNELLIVYGLLKHEFKKTLMHFQVRKALGYDDPIQSKDELYAQIGFRTFKCNPIFSEFNPRFVKHKFEKFLQTDSFLCASFYCPVTYSPCPILFFKKDSINGRFKLVASGTTIGAETDRIILKKIILTGHPYKTHKKQAVIKYMFFNAEDVKWFQPVQLWTKYGRFGEIKEPIGTHGYMKCRFDDVLGGNDTVCMSLYKRVYPKWTTEEISFE